MPEPVARLDTDHACCPRCTRWLRYLRDLADRVGLRDWNVVVMHDPLSDKGTLAQVAMAQDRRELAVSFCEGFDALDPDDQRHAVVHELVHPHFRDVWASVEDGAREAFGGMAYRVYAGAVRRQVEQSVDALASVIAEYMPEPPK